MRRPIVEAVRQGVRKICVSGDGEMNIEDVTSGGRLVLRSY
jgi:hypothetical protein